MTNRLFTRLPVPVLALAILAAPPARADNPKVNSDTFLPSVHAGDILGLPTAAMPGHLDFQAGAWLTWNHRPLKYVEPNGASAILVRDQVVVDVVASLALFRYLSIGVDLPIVFLSRGDAPPPILGLDRVGDGVGVGDLRLGLKGSFLPDRPHGFGIALAQDLSFPTAFRNRFTGDESVTGTTRLIGDFARKGWRVALDVGVKLRKDVDFGVRPFSHELLLGLGVQAPLLCGILEAIATVETRTALLHPFRSEYDASVDLMAGLRMNLKHVTVTAAAGGGALEGYGSPVPRLSLQVAYAPPVDSGCLRDRDRDGIRDFDDACPDDPGPAATRGCPDRDGDGIADRADRCPDQPGTAALKGCPDRDGDGIADPDDACPDRPGPAAHRGCPDRDGDGIVDRDDACPDVPGVPAYRGCPPPPPEVKVAEQQLELNQRVEFDTDRDTLRPEAGPILDEVAKVLKAHPELLRIRIDGHTDDVAGPGYNQSLSERRAATVRRYLVDRGVDARRLSTQGFGLSRPIADNGTEDGRNRNRRVEFTILERQAPPAK